jgi:hypothetical protein
MITAGMRRVGPSLPETLCAMADELAGDLGADQLVGSVIVGILVLTGRGISRRASWRWHVAKLESVVAGGPSLRPMAVAHSRRSAASEQTRDAYPGHRRRRHGTSASVRRREHPVPRRLRAHRRAGRGRGRGLVRMVRTMDLPPVRAPAYVPNARRHRRGARSPGGRVTPAVRERLRIAILALPKRQREMHLQALAMLLHLLEHCEEGRAPLAFIAGYRAFKIAALRLAARQLERSWVECPAPDCIDSDHVTLTSIPLGTRSTVEE